jgi:hypothetical protein
MLGNRTPKLHATDFLRCTNGDITAFIEYLVTVYKISTALKSTLMLSDRNPVDKC